MHIRSILLCAFMVGCGVENAELVDAEKLDAVGAESETAVSSEEASLGRDSTAEATSTCSCYGPGLYGNKTACGQTLQPTTIGVAHKTKKCGTSLQFRATNGTYVTATVIDRGPFAAGREFDLTEGLVKKLGYTSCRTFGVRSVEWK